MFCSALERNSEVRQAWTCVWLLSGTVTSESFLLEGTSGHVGAEPGPAEGTEATEWSIFSPLRPGVSGVFAPLSIGATLLYPLYPLLLLTLLSCSIASLSETVFF